MLIHPEGQSLALCVACRVCAIRETKGCLADAVWVTSILWQANKNCSLDIFVLKGLIVSKPPGFFFFFLFEKLYCA